MFSLSPPPGQNAELLSELSGRWYESGVVSGSERGLLLGSRLRRIPVSIRGLIYTPALRSIGSDGEKAAVAVFAAVGFVTHPLQYQVVLYMWERYALFACFFCLLSLLLYIYTRLGFIRSRTAGYGASGLFFVLGMFSKENAV